MALPTLDPNAPAFTRRFPNLADPRLGAAALACTDDFFAVMHRMLNPEPAVFVPGKYDENGTWMDGWESRRKRVAGHDWCVVRLGVRGRLAGVDIDTSHFTGNYPPAASLEGIDWDGPPGSSPGPDAPWVEALPSVGLGPSAHHYHAVDATRAGPFTHVRLHIWPDGGVARLRIYGRPEPRVGEAPETNADGRVDLVAARNGGTVIAANNQHFGLAANLLVPGRGVNMGDGWETRRRREPGNDWCILALGRPGVIEHIEVDTAFFKGNFPAGCAVRAARVEGGTEESLVTQAMFWPEVMGQRALTADAIHHFHDGLAALGPVTHVRFDIFPDGGVSRLRLWGRFAS
jgi:allantoicase